MTEETWKPIPSLDNEYLASSLGRILCIADHKVLKVFLNDGYFYVTAAGKNRRAHRLIAEAFLGPCPEGMQVCHINCIAYDNRIENLKYGTPSENMMDSIADRKRRDWLRPKPIKSSPESIKGITLFERQPGVWRIRIETKSETGERIFATETVRGTRADAEQRRTQIVQSGYKLSIGVTDPGKAATNIANNQAPGADSDL